MERVKGIELSSCFRCGLHGFAAEHGATFRFHALQKPVVFYCHFQRNVVNGGADCLLAN
jgi:hypothetical protein